MHLLARVTLTDHPVDGDRPPLSGSVEQVWSDLRAYGRAGLDHLVFWPGTAGVPGTAEAAAAALGTLASEILPAFSVRS